MLQPVSGYDAANGSLEVDKEAIGCNLSIFTTDGRLLKRMPITSTKMHLGTLPKALLLIQIEGRNVCPRALKIM